MQFFPSRACVSPTVGMHHMNTDKAYREKTRQELHKNTTNYTEQILEATSHKTAAVQPPTPHL